METWGPEAESEDDSLRGEPEVIPEGECLRLLEAVTVCGCSRASLGPRKLRSVARISMAAAHSSSLGIRPGCSLMLGLEISSQLWQIDSAWKQKYFRGRVRGDSGRLYIWN